MGQTGRRSNKLQRLVDLPRRIARAGQTVTDPVAALIARLGEGRAHTPPAASPADRTH